MVHWLARRWFAAAAMAEKACCGDGVQTGGF